MATESADGPDVSVTLPPPLDEWLDERADALDVERTEVLVQLVSAYRAACELDDGSLELSREEIEARLGDSVADRIDERMDELEQQGGRGVDRDEVDDLDERIDALESTHEADVEDLRSRVIQLRDAIRELADEDHDHGELRDLAGRLDTLSSNLEDVGADVADLTDRVDRRDDRLDDVESKLDRLAGVVLEIRDGDAGRDPRDEVLESIRATANRNRIQVADCDDCGRSVRIALLSRPECPHCETSFRDVEEPTWALGRWLDPRKPRLVGDEPPALESSDE